MKFLTKNIRVFPWAKLQSLLLFILVLTVSYLLFDKFSSEHDHELHERCLKEAQFVDSNIACLGNHTISKVGYEDLRHQILTYVQQEKEKEGLYDIAIYFRDFQNGPVFGVNELNDFSPASLLKIPLAITYYKIAEDQPGLLDKKIVYSGDARIGTQYYRPTKEIVQFQPYTIRETIEYMLAYSDNASYVVLSEYLKKMIPNGDALFLETYQDMGLLNPTSSLEKTISVRSYGTIFRLLYSIAYLSKEDSNEILQMLSRSDFQLGLRAGLPTEVPIAHKFGERFDDKDKTMQLHDCGIVYYPNNPYLLCVMTQGKDFTSLSNRR